MRAVDETDTSPEDNELSFPDGAKITNVVRNFIKLSGHLWLTICRNFLTKIGGMESMVASQVFFQPTTCNLMNDLVCDWDCTYTSGLRL